jgi:hypothetical protein
MIQAGKVLDVHGVPPNQPRLFLLASFGAKLAIAARKLTVDFLGLDDVEVDMVTLRQDSSSRHRHEVPSALVIRCSACR